jgi:hypothetical protein
MLNHRIVARRIWSVLAVATLAGVSACAPPPRYYYRHGPPPEVVEVVPPQPGPNFVWVRGHYRWDRDAAAYVWVPGHWSEPPQGYRVWVPGHWDQRPNGWFWVEGHWSVS